MFTDMGRIRAKLESIGEVSRTVMLAWSKYIWAEISEALFDDDIRQQVHKFSLSYVIVRTSILLLGGVFIVGSIGGMLLYFTLLGGSTLWKQVAKHQIEWFHSDSTLIPPLVAGAYGLIVLLWLIPELQVWGLPKLSSEQRFLLKNEARKTLAQIAGGAILLSGLYASFRTLDVSRQGQLDEQYAKAVEQLGASDSLGHPKIEVRIGGIFALERIARSSSTEFRPSVNVLLSYLQTNAGRRAKPRTLTATREDIQVIVGILGNGFSDSQTSLEMQGLDLRNTNLSDEDFKYAHLEGSDLRGADLRRTDLRQAKLDFADLSNAALEKADVSGTDLRNVRLQQAQVDTMIGDDTTKVRFGLRTPAAWHTSLTAERPNLVPQSAVQR